MFTREVDGDVTIINSKTNAIIAEICITEDMVRNELKTLNPNKSCGPDDIHPRMLIELADLITGPVTFLLNKSIEQGILPIDWKLAFISAIYKKAQNL